MEKWTESLEQYLEEGKLPLVGEIKVAARRKP